MSNWYFSFHLQSEFCSKFIKRFCPPLHIIMKATMAVLCYSCLSVEFKKQFHRQRGAHSRVSCYRKGANLFFCDDGQTAPGLNTTVYFWWNHTNLTKSISYCVKTGITFVTYLTFLKSGSNGFGYKIRPTKDAALVGILFWDMIEELLNFLKRILIDSVEFWSNSCRTGMRLMSLDFWCPY